MSLFYRVIIPENKVRNESEYLYTQINRSQKHDIYRTKVKDEFVIENLRHVSPY